MDWTFTGNDRLPASKGLPALPDNLAEGIVIKPMSAVGVETGKAPIRPVIKRKPSRFDEDDRFHAATCWSKPTTPQVSAPDTLERAVLRRVNASRIASAPSKLGPKADDAAMSYEKALAIDPDYVLAREYLGEGYVAAGRLDLARAQLGEIERRCGTDCRHYRKLAAVISGAKTELW